MEKSIGKTLKDNRNSTTSCLFCIYVWIKTRIFFRAVADISYYLLLIEETLSFIPAITGGHISSYMERALLQRPLKFD